MPFTRKVSSSRTALMSLVMGLAVLFSLPLSARPPVAVTQAQSAATLFVTVPLGVKPVSYVLGGRIWTTRSQRGIGETTVLPAAATQISLSKGAVITSSVPAPDGGEALKAHFTVTRPVTLQALNSKSIREISQYLTPGVVSFAAKEQSTKGNVTVNSRHQGLGHKEDETAPVLRKPVASKAPDCDAVGGAVKKFVEDYPDKVLETVALQVGKNKTCACEIVKAAIIASEADPELVVEIVYTAIEAAPGQFRIISQCAVAVAPNALAEVQTLISKYGSVSSDSGMAKREIEGMIRIPAGKYPGPNGDYIRTRGFWIDIHEVTIGEYAEFLEVVNGLDGQMKDAYRHPDQPADKKSHEPDDWQNLYAAARQGDKWNRKKIGLNYPVVGVDWWDAYAYARWRDRQLPSHEEWYAACSAGSDPEKLKVSGWKPVDQTEATSHGLHGMAGNVSEWMRKKTLNPDDSSLPPRHMISGGSYLRPKFGARAREWVDSRSLRRPDLGFRTSTNDLHQYALGGEKWSEKGDEKGDDKGGAGGDLGTTPEDQIAGMPFAGINLLADAVDLLSENTVNPFNVFDDIVTDSNARYVGSTDVRVPNPPPPERRTRLPGRANDFYGSEEALALLDSMASQQAFGGQQAEDSQGGRGWDTEKGSYDDFSDDEKGGLSDEEDDRRANEEVTSLYASIIGEVNKPGDIRLPSNGKIDILTAIVLAGGYSDQANRTECILQRQGTSIREAMRVNLRDIDNSKKPMVYVYEGDIVTIKKALY